MKKVFCLLLLVLLMLSYGCSNDKPDDTGDSDLSFPPLQSDPELNISPLPIPVENPEPVASSVPIDYSHDFRLILNYYESEYRSYRQGDDFITRWEEYINGKYGLDLEVVFHKTLMSSQLSRAAEGTSQFDIEHLNELTEQGGLIYIGNNADLIELYDLDLIVPLNNYLNIMDEINVIDEAVSRAVSNSEGVVLGYPLMQKTYATYRIYNGDWLAKWGNPVPKTLDEFTDYARFVRNGDPDGDGIMNTYVMKYSNMMLREFADIFRAFGCYTYNYGPFGFDPSSGNIENCFSNEGFISAMTYIKMLKDEDLLFNNMSNESYKTEIPHGFGTAIMHYEENTDVASPDLEAGFYLLGPNTENLIPITQGYGSIAVLKGTQNAEAKLQLFIDIFRNNPNAYIDFNLGIKGETYQEHEDYFYSLFTYEDEVWNIMNIRTDIGIDSDAYKPSVNVHSMEHQLVELTLSPEELGERTLKLHEIIIKSMNQEATGLTYVQDIDNYTNELHMMNMKIAMNIRDQLTKAMDGAKSVDDVATSLTNIVNNLGFQDAIDRMNYDRQNY